MTLSPEMSEYLQEVRDTFPTLTELLAQSRPGPRGINTARLATAIASQIPIVQDPLSGLIGDEVREAVKSLPSDFVDTGEIGEPLDPELNAAIAIFGPGGAFASIPRLALPLLSSLGIGFVGFKGGEQLANNAGIPLARMLGFEGFEPIRIGYGGLSVTLGAKDPSSKISTGFDAFENAQDIAAVLAGMAGAAVTNPEGALDFAKWAVTNVGVLNESQVDITDVEELVRSSSLPMVAFVADTVVRAAPNVSDDTRRRALERAFLLAFPYVTSWALENTGGGGEKKDTKPKPIGPVVDVDVPDVVIPPVPTVPGGEEEVPDDPIGPIASILRTSVRDECLFILLGMLHEGVKPSADAVDAGCWEKYKLALARVQRLGGGE